MQDLLARLFWRDAEIHREVAEYLEQFPGFAQARRAYEAVAKRVEETVGFDLYDEFQTQLLNYSDYRGVRLLWVRPRAAQRTHSADDALRNTGKATRSGILFPGRPADLKDPLNVVELIDDRFQLALVLDLQHDVHRGIAVWLGAGG